MLSLDAMGIFATVAALIVALRLAFKKRIPKGLKLPPGPPGHFLWGNLRDVPSHNEWETYSKWHEQYGDLVYINVMGYSLLYVNSAEMAYELFDKRSAIYSDRPSLAMVELIGGDWAFVMMPYGEQWRKHRRTFRQIFNSTLPSERDPVQVKHSRQLLQQLHRSPHDWTLHIRHSIGATIMEIAYGIDVLPKNDPYITTAELAADLGGRVIAPGAFLVNTLPILKYLPEWFPGARFKRKAKVWKKIVLDMPLLPFNFVKKELAAGTARPSMTATLLEAAYAKAGDRNISDEEEELIKNVAGIIYAAGNDTTSSTLEIFIFAMLLYPEAQVAAQKELDMVIGPKSLPSFEDRDKLPYIAALCKEVLRWHPLTTTAIPHRLMQDDIVGPYFIPAGTMVLGNAWGILHSETTYGPDTEMFRPERFLQSPDMKDPAAAFGFGRRACPGRVMAESSLFINVASILHVFNIVLSEGAPPLDDRAFVPGAFSRPAPFKCSFVPRSEAAVALISS